MIENILALFLIFFRYRGSDLTKQRTLEKKDWGGNIRANCIGHRDIPRSIDVCHRHVDQWRIRFLEMP